MANQRNGNKASATPPSSIVGQKNVSNGKQSKGSSAKKNQCINNKRDVISLNGIDCTDHHAVVATAVTVNETIERFTEIKSKPPNDDPRLIHANKGIVALSVLVQHLAFNVSRSVVVVACIASARTENGT